MTDVFHSYINYPSELQSEEKIEYTYLWKVYDWFSSEQTQDWDLSPVDVH